MCVLTDVWITFVFSGKRGFEDLREGVPACPRARPELTAPATRRGLMTGTVKMKR